MAAPTENKDNVMEAKASARHVRVTPQKARRVVDLIRGKQAVESYRPHLRTAATTFVWMAGFLVLVYLGGYLLAAMIFVPAFLLVVARARLKVTLIYTAVALVVLLALPSLLPVDLPEGLLTRFVS